MMTTILWLRRDLRRADHTALDAASRQGRVLPLFVIEPALWDASGPVRRGWLAATILATRVAYDDRLCVRVGDPEEIVSQTAREVDAESVHVTGETTPWGVRRDRQVRERLAQHGVAWHEHGTPYAVAPGTVRNRSGDPYQVFTPFARAWRGHLSEPNVSRSSADWVDLASDPKAGGLLHEAVDQCPIELPEAGEEAAHRRWRTFVRDGLTAYDDDRDRPDLAGTSQLSPWLKVGAIHPGRLLTDLAGRAGTGADRFVDELAWREFYADVLHHHPRSAWHDLRRSLTDMDYDAPEDALEAWQQGRTGYPIVDAGMRQLLATGWMHNRLRMITASFLTKDLHVWWPVGARFFLNHLLDGDIASNNHGWQWVAGTGTDAAPYFRVFNPVTQGKRFDPHGDYVRRWVPELAHLDGDAVHEPWRSRDGYVRGYPARIVDHAAERKDALCRYHRARRHGRD